MRNVDGLAVSAGIQIFDRLLEGAEQVLAIEDVRPVPHDLMAKVRFTIQGAVQQEAENRLNAIVDAGAGLSREVPAPPADLSSKVVAVIRGAEAEESERLLERYARELDGLSPSSAVYNRPFMAASGEDEDVVFSVEDVDVVFGDDGERW